MCTGLNRAKTCYYDDHNRTIIMMARHIRIGFLENVFDP